MTTFVMVLVVVAQFSLFIWYIWTHREAVEGWLGIGRKVYAFPPKKPQQPQQQPRPQQNQGQQNQNRDRQQNQPRPNQPQQQHQQRPEQQRTLDGRRVPNDYEGNGDGEDRQTMLSRR